jgi:two-component system NtrC family sensor kinase
MSLRDLSDGGFLESESEVNGFEGNKKYEQIWNTKNGDIISVEIISHIFNIKNKNIGMAIARDITERKQVEEEIRYFNEELVNQKENLEALVDNLTQTQEQLVHSEKMAALGQLIAGVAHEINTPLGAIKASIGNLHDSLEKAISDLPVMVEKYSADALKLFVKILRFKSYQTDGLTTREKRMIRKELVIQLEKNGIKSKDTIADLLVYLNIHDRTNELLPLLKMPEAVDILKTTRNFLSIIKNSNTITVAADKAAKVVFALKKYAHRDMVEDKISTDIIDGLETVLTLYHNQLKQGVEVIRNYETLPVIEGYPDDLNQLWTNLIHNSIQAMDLKGKLTITAKVEGEYISVSIADTGCGIEPDIRDKIFEPFFTTKKQGEGSGLGLDIVKRIVEKHEGIITFTSELGQGTEFIIKLPVNNQ